MPDQPLPPQGPEQWVDSYLNGELAAEEGQAFERWLLEDPAHIERLARAVLQDTQLRAAVISRQLESGFSLLDSSVSSNDDELRSIDRELMDMLVDQALAERRKHDIEVAANALLLADQEQSRHERRLEAKRRRAQADTEVGPRVIVIPKAVVWLGFAAVIGLVATAAVYFAPPAPSAPPTPSAPPPTAEAQPKLAPVLGTVVRTLDARWEDDADAWQGTLGLREGRHRLAEGLVEIELAEGTRVVLEGPVSFELTGANAMKLTDGRLVAHVPPSGYGFIVDTPTSRIVDYGTEFGVEADGYRATQVHVFEGEVRAAARVQGAVVGTPVPLLEHEAAEIEAGQTRVARVAFDAGAFERRVVKRLDLVDIVAGGDGTGRARMRGLHPGTGDMSRRGILDYEQAHLVSPGRYSPVASNPFIDGVFIPHRADGVQIASAGHTVNGLRVADPRSYQLLWAGGLMPSFDSEDRMRDFIARAYPADPALAPVVYMISNKGITFDLDAVREAVGGVGSVRLVAEVEHTGTGGDAAQTYRADFLGFLDGQLTGEARGLRPQSGRHAVTIEADASQRFLTLVVTDGGDGLSHDWVVLHRPVLEVLVEESRGGLTP